VKPDKRNKQFPQPPKQVPDTMIANVPVIITISHNENILQEYEEVIDIKFTQNTPEGKTNMRNMYLLKEKEGFSIETALFTLASDAVRETAEQLISKLVVLKNLTSVGNHERHLHVKRNGEIKYRGEAK